ncbi:beta-1,3-galactosyltransferase, putative [Pediculus humanus corporis]|uniref:Hexosyltransferase n=1 Tax=Pediculus humanus subsp. corporis TaxID=121224 RepID=E0VA81_PEDHC|nr:beta-1,3-galactosyltransferase, putative [Pediculus humanus corporis]EEB10287.1 beta-1,3-galactosyltransferase, putative [Pediculus humanus corporis]
MSHPNLGLLFIIYPSSVLLKYNTSEKRTCEDDALMFKIKTLLRWFLLTALLFFPFMLYVPFYFDDGDSKKPGNAAIEGWGVDTSRSVSHYVTPDNDTSLIVSNELCSEPLLLLVIICSAVNNTLERMTIRKTWGNCSNPSYSLVFLLGTTENSTLQENVEEESNLHNDIIQENFLDSYNNLTLKSVMMLKFVKNRCKNVRYIFKCDDDMFVYLPNLLALIKVLDEKNVKNVLIGKLICGAKPILEVRSKWYAPRYLFSEKVYPNYLSGTGYLMDRHTALDLYEAALEIPYLHLEDVFITGLCARKAKIKPRHHSGFTYLTRPLDPCLYIKNENVITSHRVTTSNMTQLWTALNNGTKCFNGQNTHPLPIKLEFLKPSSSVGKKNRCS